MTSVGPMAKKMTVRELPDGPPDATGLTPRQQRVLATIKDSIESAATRRACARSARPWG